MRGVSSGLTKIGLYILKEVCLIIKEYSGEVRMEENEKQCVKSVWSFICRGAPAWVLNPIPTGTGLNQPIYSYHVTQAGRNRVKNAFIYVVQNMDLNKNGSNTKMTFEVLQIKHGLAPWGG